MLVIDETGFLKQGLKSVGVKRQYSGTAGRIENSQIGVFLTYAAPEGHVLLDRERTCPASGQTMPSAVRRRGARGGDVCHQTGTRPPDAGTGAGRGGTRPALVTGDSIYASMVATDGCASGWRYEQPFVLAVAKDEPLWAVVDERWGQPRADLIAEQLPAEAWKLLSAGDGAKGPRWYDWARVPLARLQLTEEERRWEHWLLVRRSRSDPTDFAYYVVFAPTGTTLQTLVRVAGQRWRIEQSFALAKVKEVLNAEPSAALGRLVPTHDTRDVRAGLPGGPTCTATGPSRLSERLHHLARTQPRSQKKGAISAAARPECCARPVYCPGDSACALGLRAGGLSSSNAPGGALVRVASPPPGTSQALPLPASPGPDMTCNCNCKTK